MDYYHPDIVSMKRSLLAMIWTAMLTHCPSAFSSYTMDLSSLYTKDVTAIPDKISMANEKNKNTIFEIIITKNGNMNKLFKQEEKIQRGANVPFGINVVFWSG
jgi:hypothetical protein